MSRLKENWFLDNLLSFCRQKYQTNCRCSYLNLKISCFFLFQWWRLMKNICYLYCWFYKIRNLQMSPGTCELNTINQLMVKIKLPVFKGPLWMFFIWPLNILVLIICKIIILNKNELNFCPLVFWLSTCSCVLQQEVENFKKLNVISQDQFDTLAPKVPAGPNQEVTPASMAGGFTQAEQRVLFSTVQQVLNMSVCCISRWRDYV